MSEKVLKDVINSQYHEIDKLKAQLAKAMDLLKEEHECRWMTYSQYQNHLRYSDCPVCKALAEIKGDGK
jgi:hypothetical protein